MKSHILTVLVALYLLSSSLHAQTPEIEVLLKTLNQQKGKEKVDAYAELCFKFYMIDPSRGIVYGEKALKMADSLKLPEAKSKACNNIGVCYLALSDPASARSSFQMGLHFAVQYHDSTQIATSYNRLGVLYERTGVFDSALIMFNQALTMYSKLKNYQRVGVLNENIGMIHLHRGELKTSLTFLLKAKASYEMAGSKNSIPPLLCKIGRVYAESHDYPSAEKWYSRGKQLAIEINDVQSAGIAMNALGILYKEQNLHTKALAQFQEVLKLPGLTGNKNLLLAVYNNIGNVYDNMGEGRKSLVYHKQALAIAETINDPVIIAKQQVGLGGTYNSIKDYSAALQLLQKALPVFTGSKIHTDLLATYQAVIVASNGLKNYQQSVDFYEKYIALKDSLTHKEQSTALDSLKVKFNTEQTINENLLLAQKNLIQSKTISLQKTIMVSALLFAVLLIGFVVFVIRSRQKIKKINRLLAIKNDEISATAYELKAKNKQLVEFARYKDSMNSFLVHDLKNPLNTIINSNIEQLTRQEAEGIRQSGLRMLNIVSNLLYISKHENQMLSLSLAEAPIGQMIHDAYNETLFIAKQKNVSFTLRFHSDFTLRVDVEMIKRVFVNMFTNAIKFSQTNGNIQLFAEIIPHSTLKISIQDDGEGISPEYLPFVFERYTQEIPRNVGLSASTGIGLSFCKMAVELHGCKIGVSSEKGKGTTFWFTLPLAGSHNPDAGKLQGIKMEPDNIAGFILSKEEKEFLLPYCRLLEQLSIYQLTEVKDIVKPIESNMPNISTWKMLVLDSLAACNETSYRKLITLCHG